MKNLHKISPPIPDILWACSWWFRSQKALVKYNKTLWYRHKYQRRFHDSLWTKDSENYVLAEWKRAKSPKTNDLRERIVI